MSNLRAALTAGVVFVAVIGAIAGFVIVEPKAPEAAWKLVAVNAGVIVALAVTVWVMLGPLTSRIDLLVEALRALARGDKHTRVNVEEFAGLAEIARATNEVGASLCEHDDPNLGPVVKHTRDRAVEAPTPRRSAGETRPPPEAPTLPRVPPRGAVQEGSEHSEIGAVRVRPRNAERASDRPSDHSSDHPAEAALPQPIIDGESVSEARPRRAGAARASSSAPKPDIANAETVIAASVEGHGGGNDTVIEAAAVGASSVSSAPEAETDGDAAKVPIAGAASADAPVMGDPATDAGDGATSSVGGKGLEAEARGAAGAARARTEGTKPTPRADAELPGRDELHALFKEFVQEKKAAGVESGLDVDFDAFAETIRGECERLLAEHQCRGVRFEVAVGDGEVSLRPRLLR